MTISERYVTSANTNVSITAWVYNSLFADLMQIYSKQINKGKKYILFTSF